MRIYSHETRRLTRSGNFIAAATTVGSVLALAACGNGEGMRDEGAASSESATRSPEDIQSTRVADIGAASLNKLVWPGTVELTNACPVWSKDHHGPLTVAKGKDGKPQLLVMADARLSSPRDCNPETDSGAGMQYGASSKSGGVELPAMPELYNGSYVADGVVLRVNRYTTVGEKTCQSDGSNGTTTWIEVQAMDGDPLGWMPTALTGYEPDVADMKRAEIPVATEQAVYAGTVQGGCPGS
ncbi:MAG TPA: hypothetical protein VLA92_00995 [Candidatus Saccharimonadales bacterium]|nr:hypothetical protein [Candidatus Saccharimonadales bacterium]